MPVRKIPKNYLCVTGSFASRKNQRMLGFESLLERDFMIQLEFDDSVERFEEQPVKIPLQNKGKKTRYVPDILIHYRTLGAKVKKPVLAEIKSRTDLEKNKVKYAPKFSAAKQFALQQNWQFRVIDDTAVRIPCLPNLKFLREYHLITPDSKDVDLVLDALAEVGGWIELETFLDNLCKTDKDRLRLLPVIWHLVAIKQIATDLDKPFSSRTVFSLPS